MKFTFEMNSYLRPTHWHGNGNLVFWYHDILHAIKVMQQNRLCVLFGIDLVGNLFSIQLLLCYCCVVVLCWSTFVFDICMSSKLYRSLYTQCHIVNCSLYGHVWYTCYVCCIVSVASSCWETTHALPINLCSGIGHASYLVSTLVVNYY